MINDFSTTISIEEKLIDGMKLETRLEMEKKKVAIRTSQKFDF